MEANSRSRIAFCTIFELVCTAAENHRRTPPSAAEPRPALPRVLPSTAENLRTRITMHPIWAWTPVRTTPATTIFCAYAWGKMKKVNKNVIFLISPFYSVSSFCTKHPRLCTKNKCQGGCSDGGPYPNWLHSGSLGQEPRSIFLQKSRAVMKFRVLALS